VFQGFIDFIVDPSFQVMGDMIEKIMEPIRQNRQEGKIDKATSTASLNSKPESPATPRSPPSPGK
jgi:calcium/calmodulin-dependent 3',5'-cyclic nucleotide phosphodiesterase